MLKLIKKYLLEGIGWGCFILVMNMVCDNLFRPEILPEIFENFIFYALPQILIIMGFVSTCIVYEVERLHIGLRMLIHLASSITILLIVGFSFGIYSTQNLSNIPIDILNNMLIIFALWTYYYLKERRELQQINAKLLEKSLEQQSDTE